MPTTINVHKMPILSTFDPPPGYEIDRVIGPCWGITVRSRSVVGTACAGCQTFFGGEITMLTELANDSRNEAMNRLEEHAVQMGADAILAMRSTRANSCRTPTKLWPMARRSWCGPKSREPCARRRRAAVGSARVACTPSIATPTTRSAVATRARCLRWAGLESARDAPCWPLA